MTCYDSRGYPQSGMQPCFPNIPATGTNPCCGTVDLCLSNGLCLNLGADNEFTAQGCTNQHGTALALATAENGKDNINLYAYLVHCSGFHYCCGFDRSCCNNSDSVFTLAKFTVINYPYSPTTTSSSLSSTAPPSDNNATNNDDYKQKIITGLAAGLGVPLSLILIAGGCFFYWRRRNRQSNVTGPLIRFTHSG
ncbi:hypothetical protein B0T26DRAFT_671466 [Lasiosphaeria miniovina]|uniref:Uncharacterized protein n=1 Tax=Lasiosphaeria miniovina TaxID=1954250 RepID=A0AA40B388_9PEZI|nr:uncharacterized protein B0T26DRAFT_671466 [Lasiosphaeria miniovina]KAK0726698.1 hypothetical protein B0T26DRAFT_671466 [Lasiosphaeria miniovina]